MLVIKRIHVKYRLKIDAANRDKAERVMKAHVAYCPVARSLAGRRWLHAVCVASVSIRRLPAGARPPYRVSAPPRGPW